ncbi:hypothetical protein E5K00_22490 [Hymenobacter aquaticus]|uniref:DUF6089 domain-containing protein n=1 Tax=Hymenobacter aquaticus TaxID=1867101 RepID=A0A4Z0PWD9_9BACT|nr:DUF6089 family protein [Hymenobacter aquaticus]TGE20752.1 hypothetical protein E5K00_22490 [Hymenobacter aquaticus]
MKLTTTFFLLPAVAATLLGTAARAQSFTTKNRYTTVDVSLNAMNYFGDVVPKVTMSSLRAGASRPNVGISLTRRLTTRFSARVAVAYGRISGEDSKAADPRDDNARFRYHRNMNFRNDIVEVSAVGRLDLFRNHYSYLRRPNLMPYVFGGIALFHHNPKGYVQGGTIPKSLAEGSYVALQPLRTEGQDQSYNRTQLAIPFGFGVRYRLSNNLDLGLEIGWRKTFTDYLDDVSGNYTDVANLTSDAARYFGHDVTRTENPDAFVNFNAPGSMRGRSTMQDWYIVTGLSVNYILVKKQNGGKFR